MNTRAFKRTPVAQAVSLILGSTFLAPAFAQDANPEATNLDEIVVTGIRGSLTSSMNLKREAMGVVDGIVAEDIGKFPDTNLAESLQRISGVSIDRSIGEGSRITVRGVGPDYNLVLLNGRQMPGSSIADTSASNSRSFDFANLASEAISGVEVYKTSRASSSTGGIGATVNIKTTRPLDAPGTRVSFGVKGVNDTSASNLPDNLKGSDFTPEVSGIFSMTSEDGTFGIAATASYQERDLGFNQAAVGNGWRPFAGDENNWGTIPNEGAPGSQNITNHPGPDDIYSVPQNLGYSVNGIERKRTNGQLTFQFKPIDTMTATLDYTYSENKVHTRRNELSVWFNFGPSVSTWTDGPVAAPLSYSETINGPGFSDLSMGGAEFATKNVNNSTGFNLAWEASDRLGFEFDFHNSTATSGSDSPFGSNATLGVATFDRGTTTADFSQDFPVMSVVLPNGRTSINPALAQVTGSSFRNSYTKAEVQQEQLKGKFALNDSSKLDFGLAFTEVNNRSAFANVQSDNTWGGIPGVSPDDYPDDVWQLQNVRGYFDQISGSSNPNLFNEFFSWNFRDVRQLVADARGLQLGNTATCALNGNESIRVPCYEASNQWGTDRRTQEKSKSAYLQYSVGFDTALPINVGVGVRYEKTDVTSTALVPIPIAISWTGNNEFPIQFEKSPGFTTLTGSYDYVLPSVDFSIDLTSSLKLRASYGQSIGRPGWGDIQGGQILNGLARADGGDASQGDPNLKPLESKNYDLSVEWYYADASYMSIGYFKKDIDNYIGATTFTTTEFNLPHPGIGAGYYDEAAADCAENGQAGEITCIRNFIFLNHDGDPGVVRGLDNDAGDQTGTITGIPGDPLAEFEIQIPTNQRSAKLDGWELAIQHMFGDSGFGASANYTKVDSNLAYNNFDRNNQFAIVGLSDSANVVAFYEKHGWSVRAAYNWRDEFLAGLADGAGSNPAYVEAYGQLDLNVGYNITDNFSVALEAINLTNETQRLHGRDKHEALFVTQTGARYMIGARYKFGQ
ncbi:MAG: TonB-dependent receptor [Pseudomonadota bacterium]